MRRDTAFVIDARALSSNFCKTADREALRPFVILTVPSRLMQNPFSMPLDRRTHPLAGFLGPLSNRGGLFRMVFGA
jgi:hypothetical protein